MPDDKHKEKKHKKLLKIISTQMWSQIYDVKDGIIITKDGQYAMILEFAPINFSLLPVDEQIVIADTFGAILKTFPSIFQIKILSRKANVETHLRTLKKCHELETNPKCRQMQEQSMNQIKLDSYNGVSRRFLIAFQFDGDSGLRSPSWNTIRSKLYFTANQIASMLSSNPCNNLLLSPIGSTEHTLDILYNCVCRREAELKPFDIKVQDTVASHIVEQGYNENMYIPVNDFISPQKIDATHFSYLEVDNKYYRHAYIFKKSYPTEIAVGWMSKLVGLGEGIDIDIFCEAVSNKTVSTELTYSSQASQADFKAKDTSAADITELKNKIDSQRYIRDGISNGFSFLYFSVVLTVVADSLDHLNAKYRAVEEQISGYNLELRSFDGNQDLAFQMCLPLCNQNKSLLRHAKRNILSCDLGSAYPFGSYEINDPEGILLGRNKANNSPLFLDLFDRRQYSNGNWVIYGGTGSGKTYTLQCIALRQRQYQSRVIIIAPWKGFEYAPACNSIGGSFISLAPGSPHNINIMEIRKHRINGEVILDGVSSTNGSLLTEKIQQLHTFFSLLKPDMSHRETQILDECLLKTYKSFGITPGNKSLIDPYQPNKFKDMPTLGDLDKSLITEGKAASGLREVLSIFITGSCKSFNRPTNVNMDNPYVVIDISNMPDKLLPIGIFIANDFVYDAIREDEFQRKIIINDELSRLIGPAGTPDVAKFVLWEFKTVRAYNASIIAATQDTNDFFALDNGHYGKGILANAKIKLVMKQESEEVPTITNLMMLSETESKRLAYYEPGEGLLIANRNHIEIKVVASDAEDRLINTDPEKKRRWINSDKEGVF